VAEAGANPRELMERMGHSTSRAPTATRTRDLLLRRHSRRVPGRCWAWPDVPFGAAMNGWRWPGVALCPWSLAPRLAPHDLVSSANVRMIRTMPAQSRLQPATPPGTAGLVPRPRRWLPSGRDFSDGVDASDRTIATRTTSVGAARDAIVAGSQRHRPRVPRFAGGPPAFAPKAR